MKPHQSPAFKQQTRLLSLAGWLKHVQHWKDPQGGCEKPEMSRYSCHSLLKSWKRQPKNKTSELTKILSSLQHISLSSLPTLVSNDMGTDKLPGERSGCRLESFFILIRLIFALRAIFSVLAWA